MYQTFLICFITSTLFLSPALGQTADPQIANANTSCIGTACVQTPPTSNQSTTSSADFNPTPVELLLAGVALIALRMAAKKYFLSKVS